MPESSNHLSGPLQNRWKTKLPEKVEAECTRLAEPVLLQETENSALDIFAVKLQSPLKSRTGPVESR